MPLVAITKQSRQPFEVCTLGGVALYGIPLLTGDDSIPASLTKALSGPGQVIWGVVLVVGAVLTIVGIYWRERSLGVLLEQIGLVSVGFTTILYSAALWIFATASADLGAIVFASIGIACFVRWFNTSRIMKKARLVKAQEEARLAREQGESSGK